MRCDGTGAGGGAEGQGRTAEHVCLQGRATSVAKSCAFGSGMAGSQQAVQTRGIYPSLLPSTPHMHTLPPHPAPLAPISAHSTCGLKAPSMLSSSRSCPACGPSLTAAARTSAPCKEEQWRKRHMLSVQAESPAEQLPRGHGYRVRGALEGEDQQCMQRALKS